MLNNGIRTGKEYLAGLRDDREIWTKGKRVKDVTKHPAFRNSVQSIARLYDCLLYTSPSPRDRG